MTIYPDSKLNVVIIDPVCEPADSKYWKLRKEITDNENYNVTDMTVANFWSNGADLSETDIVLVSAYLDMDGTIVQTCRNLGINCIIHYHDGDVKTFDMIGKLQNLYHEAVAAGTVDQFIKDYCHYTRPMSYILLNEHYGEPRIIDCEPTDSQGYEYDVHAEYLGVETYCYWSAWSLGNEQTTIIRSVLRKMSQMSSFE